jgi:uncharacterized protein (UPF0335 family)
MRKSPPEQLVHHVQNLERLEAEKQAAAAEFRAGLAGARAAGFDPGTLRVVLRLRKLTPGQRKERRALEAIYLAALGMLEGDPLPDEARRRLDEEPQRDQPEKGLTEAGSKSQRESKTAPPAPPQLPMNLKDPEEARQEGRTAAAAGKRIYDNPYPAGDLCRAAWDEGWCERKKSNGMDTPSAFQRRSDPPEKSGKDEKGAA